MYTTGFCPYCLFVKRLFDDLHVPFQEVRVDLDPDTGNTVVRTIKVVVETVEESDLEISLSQAQNHFPDIKKCFHQNN